MARRILYNPADFVEASTPFYDNIIGTITDQSQRIERNMLLQREERMVEEGRQFEVAMAERRFQMQESLQQDAFAHQGEQNRLQREQADEHHGDVMDWRWASLIDQRLQQLRQQQEAANRDFESQRKELEKEVNGMFNTLVGSNLVPSGAPPRLYVGFDEDSGQFTVLDYENQNVTPYEQWVSTHTPLYNLSRSVLNNQNFTDWAKSKLYNARDDFSGRDTYTGRTLDGQPVDVQVSGDTFVDGEGNAYVGYDSFISMVDQVRNRTPGWEMAQQGLNDILDNESSFRLLMKDDERAEMFDSANVASTMTRVRDILDSGTTYRGTLLDPDTNQFLVEDAPRYMPNPMTKTFDNMPNQSVEGKNIGQMQRSLIDYENAFGYSPGRPDGFRSGDYRYESMRSAVTDLYKLALETISTYKDDLPIPADMRDFTPERLAKSARLNEFEYYKDRPNAMNLFTWPYDEKGIAHIRDSDDPFAPIIRAGETRQRMIEAGEVIRSAPREHWEVPRDSTRPRVVPRDHWER